MLRQLVQSENWRGAGVLVLKLFHPRVAAALEEDRTQTLEDLLTLRPLGVLEGDQIFLPQRPTEVDPELGLEGADAEEPSVRGLVEGVVGRAAVERVFARRRQRPRD